MKAAGLAALRCGYWDSSHSCYKSRIHNGFIDASWRTTVQQAPLLAYKEVLLSKIQEQLDIGSDSLDEQDQFLLECNFNKFAASAGEHQEHWLLAIQVAREASRIRDQQAEAAQP